MQHFSGILSEPQNMLPAYVTSSKLCSSRVVVFYLEVFNYHSRWGISSRICVRTRKRSLLRKYMELFFELLVIHEVYYFFSEAIPVS